jgi:transposase InsO family protein
VQFTSAAFVDELQARGVRVSMDGRGRFLDNIFIERLWRSLKYEDIFIKAYETPAAARAGIGGWLAFYNDERAAPGARLPHAASRVRGGGVLWIYGQRSCCAAPHDSPHSDCPESIGEYWLFGEHGGEAFDQREQALRWHGGD